MRILPSPCISYILERKAKIKHFFFLEKNGTPVITRYFISLSIKRHDSPTLRLKRHYFKNLLAHISAENFSFPDFRVRPLLYSFFFFTFVHTKYTIPNTCPSLPSSDFWQAGHILILVNLRSPRKPR